MHKIIYFYQNKKKYLKKKCVPTLPEFFRNTLISLFGLTNIADIEPFTELIS